jgi:phage tail sheath gpL-like
MINFNIYPASNRVPGVYAEIDPSQANTGTVNQKTLLIGQQLAGATTAPNIPVMVTSYALARTLFGAGSMLSLMYAQYRKSDNFGEVWALPLADNGAGVANVATVAVAGTATAAGTVNLYVAGQLVQAAVNSGMTAAQAATALNAAINAYPDLPVSSAVAVSTVTITARHKGAAAGDVDVRLNYGGPAAGEFSPAGLTFTIANPTPGVTDPVQVFTNLGDSAYDWICTPYSGTTEVGQVTSLLNDTTGRWSWQTSLFGCAFGARKGTAAALATFGDGLNDQHVSILGLNDSPTPVYLIAADYAAVCANSLRADPALPLQNLLMNIQAPPRQARFLLSERNTLYYDGVASIRVSDAGQVILDRAVTTYQKNAAGSADNSYLDVETMACLQFLIRDLKDTLAVKFARRKLVADGTAIPGGSNFVTSQHVKGEVIGWYRNRAAEGLCQNPKVFAKNIRAENAGNGRVSLLLPLDVANQLRITSMLIQFIKS